MRTLNSYVHNERMFVKWNLHEWSLHTKTLNEFLFNYFRVRRLSDSIYNKASKAFQKKKQLMQPNQAIFMRNSMRPYDIV